MAGLNDVHLINPPSNMSDEVFQNGERDSVLSELSTFEDNLKSTPGIPRRSSLVKDLGRRPTRKKTVSFSSMPNEKKVVTGEFLLNSGVYDAMF